MRSWFRTNLPPSLLRNFLVRKSKFLNFYVPLVRIHFASPLLAGRLPFLGGDSTVLRGTELLDDLAIIRFPELVIGVAGPIGIDIDTICLAIEEALRAVSYSSAIIKLTDEIQDIPSSKKNPKRKDFFKLMNFKMDHASDLCRSRKDSAFLMRVAIAAIRRERDAFIQQGKGLLTDPNFQEESETRKDSTASVAYEHIGATDQVAHRVAYIVRQIKRPDEVMMMRRVYGKQFILVSAYGTESDRRDILIDKIKKTMPLNTGINTVTFRAQSLINRDADEEGDEFGQHLRDSFHLADVFVDGISKVAMSAVLVRFFNAFFGMNSISPTKWEYGMYSAKSASLRSADLSRQVGAAIFSRDGELIVQGCNEVPKAFGGTYWDTETPDNRDVSLGRDPNEEIKREIVRDILERLDGAKMLKIGQSAKSDIDDLIDHLTGGSRDDNDKSKGALKGSKLLDLTEYGRVVHAEMCALCDAARLGRSVKDSILFCTTFPCHNCTKHILAAGVRLVVFMEPYPKSKAQELHSNEIEVDSINEKKVSFIPFLGISPHRYRDVFEKKGKRKSGSVANKWFYDNVACPMIDVLAPSYTELERFVVIPLATELSPSELKT